MGFLGDIVNDSRTAPAQLQPLSKTVGPAGERAQHIDSDVAALAAVDVGSVAADASGFPTTDNITNIEHNQTDLRARLHSTIDSNPQTLHTDGMDEFSHGVKQNAVKQIENISSTSSVKLQDEADERSVVESSVYIQADNSSSDEQNQINSAEGNDSKKYQQEFPDQQAGRQATEVDNLLSEITAPEKISTDALIKNHSDGLQYTIKSEVVNKLTNKDSGGFDFGINLSQAFPPKEQTVTDARQNQFDKQQKKSSKSVNSDEVFSIIADSQQEKEINSQPQKEKNNEQSHADKLADNLQQQIPVYETPAERFARKLELQQVDNLQAIEQVQQYRQQQHAQQIQQALTANQQTQKKPSQPRVHIGQIDIIVYSDESPKPKQAQQNSVKKSSVDLWYLKSL